MAFKSLSLSIDRRVLNVSGILKLKNKFLENTILYGTFDFFLYRKAATKTRKMFAGNTFFEAQPRAKLPTGLPEDVGDPLKNLTIKAIEDLNNDLEQLAVERHRTKTINTDEEIKKESESTKPKKKKKITNYSANTRAMDFAKKKHQKDKKGNIEKKNSDKETEHKNHKDKHNKPTEKNMNHDNDTSIQNTTILWYRGMSEERLNDGIKKKKKTVDKDKKKRSKKSKQIDKNNDDKRMSKVIGQSLPSSKDLKVQPGINTKKVLISRSSPKPQPKLVRVGVVDRTMYKSKVAIRASKNKNGEKIRNLGKKPGGRDGVEEAEAEEGEYEEEEGGNDDGDKHKDHDKPVKAEKHQHPSHLSPYAIRVQMLELMKEFPNVNATVTKFTRTVEYNDIVLITVTDKKGSERYSRAKASKYIDDAPEKKIIFIVHGLTVMGMKNMPSLIHISQLKLLFSYYFKYIDKFDFYIIPLANPDGYSCSRSFSIPIWNKNVSPQAVCPGVFVDRNFDIGWNATKEISSCSQLYPGATPFSEVESQAVRDVFHYFSHKIMAYIHVHAGTYDEKVFKGDAILYPRGFTETQTDDDKYIDLKGEIDEAMKNASFRVISVSVDTLANWYGVISGSSVDYAASVFGIPYALEYVMQIYDTETLNSHALTQIWSRLIDTTLNHLWKSLHTASEERKSH